MLWNNDTPQGMLHIPETVAFAVAGTDFEQIKNGEVLLFSLALGSAVAIATFSNCELCLCGDKSVWSEMWGRLQVLDDLTEKTPH
jgi:hypothetical protein